jgi:hypothetical protein
VAKFFARNDWTTLGLYLDGKRYTGTQFEKKLLAIALGHMPGLSNPSAEILVVSIIASFSANCADTFHTRADCKLINQSLMPQANYGEQWSQQYFCIAGACKRH